MTVVGTITLLATIDTSQYERGVKDIERSNKEIEGSAGQTEKRSNNAFNRVAKVGLAAIAAGAVTAGAMITKNIGGAIRRVDTLNNSTRVFENMGFEASETEKAMERLVEGITGLPTSLDSAVVSLQQLSAANRDIAGAERIYQALNNAVLAFGSETSTTESAVTALSRAINSGRLQGDQFNTLMDNMGPVINQIADDMGITTQALQKGLSDGSISVSDFIDELLRLNEEGSGSFASLKDQARDATGGIGTSFSNMNIAIQKGIGEVVKAIGNDNITNAVAAIGNAFQTALTAVADGFRFAGEAISVVIEWLQPLIDYIKNNQTLIDTLKNTLLVLGGILLGAVLAGIVVVVAAVAALTFVVEVLVGVFTWVMEAGIAAWEFLSNAWSGAVDFFSGIWDGIKSIFSGVASFFGGVFTSAWDIVTGVFSAAVGFFSGVWNGVVAVFSPVVGFFSGVFQGAWNAIKSVFSAVSGFFRGVWDTIVSIFTNVGTAVGNAIGGTFKNIINTILKGAIGIINGFIDAINLAVDIINNIPGVNIGRLDRLNVPQLATGGVVTSATLAVIGEGSEPEAVIPLSKLDQMLSGEGSGGRDVTVNQYNTINDNIDMNIATRYLTKELARS